MTTCQFPAIRHPRTYKSQRSAKLAVGKAEQAYEAAIQNRCTDEYRGHMLPETRTELDRKVAVYIEDTARNLEATLMAAREQGYLASSYWMAARIDSQFQ